MTFDEFEAMMSKYRQGVKDGLNVDELDAQTLELIDRGVQQSRNGQVRSLGSFAEYADDDFHKKLTL